MGSENRQQINWTSIVTLRRAESEAYYAIKLKVCYHSK